MKFLMYQAQIKDEGPKTPPSIIHELKRCQPHLYIDVFLILVLLIITILLLWLLIHNFLCQVKPWKHENHMCVVMFFDGFPHFWNTRESIDIFQPP